MERLITEKTERELRDSETAIVRRHLQTCASCRAFLHAHDEVLDLFVHDFGPAPASLLSTDFTDRILARLNQQLDPTAPVAAAPESVDGPPEPVGPAEEADPEAGPEITEPEIPDNVEPSPSPAPRPESEPFRRPSFEPWRTGKPVPEEVRSIRTGPGRIRRLLRPTALLAASLLIAVVVAWLFLSDSVGTTLDTWNDTVAWRSADSRNWHPVRHRLSLEPGDAVYTTPGSQARLVLADGTTLDLPGDSYLEQADTGPRLPEGHAYVCTAGAATVTVQTPFASVELTAGGEFLLGVNRPDTALPSPAHPTGDAEVAADGVEAGEVVIWALSGIAHVTPRTSPDGPEPASRFQVTAGQVRTFLPGGHPVELPGYELETLGRILEPLQRSALSPPESGATSGPFIRADLPLAASLSEALRQNDSSVRTLAVHVAGRLGLDSVVSRAVHLARAHDATPMFKCAVVRALTRTRGPAGAQELLALLDDPSPRVQAAVTRSLEQVPVPGARDRLTSLVRNSHDARVRHGAARALASLAEPVQPAEHAKLAIQRERQEVGTALRDLKGPVLLELPEAIDRVGRYLADRRLDSEVRREAASLLTNVDDPSIEPWIIPALTDPDSTVRTLALKVIADTKRFSAGLAPEVIQSIRNTANRTGTPALERKAAVEVLVHRGLAVRRDLVRLITAAGAPDKVRLAALEGWCQNPEPAAEYERLFQAVSVETRPSVPVLSALLRHYGDRVERPDPAWLMRQLADSRPDVACAAARALNAAHDRGTGTVGPADAERLGQQLKDIAGPAARLSLIHLITKLLPTEASQLHFLENVLQGATASETCSVLGLLKNRKSAEAARVLKPLLRHEDPRVVTAAVQALGTLGPVAGVAVPDLVRLYQTRLQHDPRLREQETFSLVKTLFRLGEVRSALPALSGLIERGEDRAEDAVQEIHSQLGTSAATALLINYHDHPRTTVRLAIARAFLAGVPEVQINKIRGWWKNERDSWTRFALAFVLVKHVRAPAVEALHWMRRTLAPTQRANLARTVGETGFESFAALVANPDRKLPAGWREGLQAFLAERPWGDAGRAVTALLHTAQVRGEPSGPSSLPSLEAYGKSWIDRVRSIRCDLWHDRPNTRRMAALDAQSVLDRTLVPILIDKLLDPEDVEVRRAAASTLSRISQPALAHYDPTAEGEELRRQVARVRTAFRALDLEALLPGPLPLALSPR